MVRSASKGARVAAGIVCAVSGATAGAAAIYVTVGRVGWRRTRLPDRLLQLGAWVVFMWPAVGTLNPNTTWGQRAVTLPLAIAAFVVALNGIGATRAGVWLIGHVVSPLQTRLLLATGGRVSLTGKLPVLLLTATGRRSGTRRTIPLIFLRDGDDLVVCNVRPPSERPNPWPLNVRANPNVTVRIGGVTEQRVAREARAHEVEKYWPLLIETWPAYERFFADTHERAVFVLQRRRPNVGKPQPERLELRTATEAESARVG